MWFECKPCNLEFFEVAPFKIVTEIILPASPLKVFQTFADPMSWPQWFKEIKSVTWTSQQIDKVNATREVVLKILGIPITLRERFIAWDKGERFAFSIDAASLPMLVSGAEDYRLERLSENQTRLLWLYCYEPKLATRPFDPLARVIFQKMFQRAAGRLADYVRLRG